MQKKGAVIVKFIVAVIAVLGLLYLGLIFFVLKSGKCAVVIQNKSGGDITKVAVAFLRGKYELGTIADGKTVTVRLRPCPDSTVHLSFRTAESQFDKDIGRVRSRVCEKYKVEANDKVKVVTPSLFEHLRLLLLN